MESTITQANKVLGPGSLEAFVDLIDGIHAAGLSDLNVVSAIGAYKLWESTVINSVAENQTLAQFLRAAGLSWRARGELAANTAAADFAAFVGRARGLPGSAVAAVWASGTLIRDMYSGASKGEIELTMSHFWGFQIPRPTNFARIKFVA